jgi:NADPH:quinone reductase-like Zn-dependent oxidoreductase
MNLPIWSLPYIGAGAKGIAKDFSGSVISAGASSGFKKDDEVFGLYMSMSRGTLSEVAVIDVAPSAGEAVVLKKPKEWSWNEAASLPLVWLTARTTIAGVESYVEKGSGNKLVVLGGSSATGMYTVWLAKQRGWTVLSTCSGRNTDFVKDLGADTVVDYTSSSVPNAVKTFSPAAIIDCVGGTECLGLAARYITIVGDKTSRSSMGGSMLYLVSPRMVLRKLLGAIGWGEHYDCIILKQDAGYLQEAVDTLTKDRILIDSSFEFDRVKEAFERLNTGRARGKVVVEVDK